MAMNTLARFIDLSGSGYSVAARLLDHHAPHLLQVDDPYAWLWTMWTNSIPMIYPMFTLGMLLWVCVWCNVLYKIWEHHLLLPLRRLLQVDYWLLEQVLPACSLMVVDQASTMPRMVIKGLWTWNNRALLMGNRWWMEPLSRLGGKDMKNLSRHYLERHLKSIKLWNMDQKQMRLWQEQKVSDGGGMEGSDDRVILLIFDLLLLFMIILNRTWTPTYKNDRCLLFGWMYSYWSICYSIPRSTWWK